MVAHPRWVRLRPKGNTLMTDKTPAAEAEPKNDATPKPKEGEPLGEGGKAAIEAEREARKAAEAQFKTLKGEFDGFKASLSKAFGVDPATDDNADTLKTVQEQLSAIQHESAVLRLANEHKITDKDDLEILGSAKDAEAMQKLAARLAAKADEDANTNSPGPRADLTQGGKGEPAALNSNALEDALKAKLGIT